MLKDYQTYKSVFEDCIYDYLPKIDAKSKTIEKAMKYSIDAGGKRLRPVLTLASCEFMGGNCTDALPYACAIEYIHTYSLIHDDLPALDNDELRRGKPTNHMVFGEAMAILAGDGLLSSAFEAMTRDMASNFYDTAGLQRRVFAANEIALAAGCQGMVAGQIADIEAEGALCSKEMLQFIHKNKCGAMIRGAVRAGAHIGGSDSKKLEALTVYAENLGFAFQIADDILDVIGDEKTLGKHTGMDAERNKSTYPALYGLETSKKVLANLTEAAVAALTPYGKEANFFFKLVNDLAVRIS